MAETRVVIVVVVVLLVFILLSKTQSQVGTVVGADTHLPNATVVMVDSCHTTQDVCIRALTLSHITHVGVIVRDASDTPFLFHTSSKRGACLVHWDTWLRANAKKSRVLCRTPSVRVSNSDMEHAISGLYGRKYAYHLWKSVFMRWFHAELPVDNNQSLFCSELICLVFENLGMVDFTSSNLSPSLVLPFHFGDDNLPFVGVHFSAPLEINLS
jgi:hypothetical protein